MHLVKKHNDYKKQTYGSKSTYRDTKVGSLNTWRSDSQKPLFVVEGRINNPKNQRPKCIYVLEARLTYYIPFISFHAPKLIISMVRRKSSKEPVIMVINDYEEMKLIDQFVMAINKSFTIPHNGIKEILSLSNLGMSRKDMTITHEKYYNLLIKNILSTRPSYHRKYKWCDSKNNLVQGGDFFSFYDSCI